MSKKEETRLVIEQWKNGLYPEISQSLRRHRQQWVISGKFTIKPALQKNPKDKAEELILIKARQILEGYSKRKEALSFDELRDALRQSL